MTLCVHITIPLPFINEELAVYFQSFTRDFYNDLPGARVVIMITATEEELSIALKDYPQINILEKHQPNGLRAGLTLAYDENANPVIGGVKNYIPDPASLASAKKNGTPIDNDDVLRLAGWAKRDYAN